MKPLAFALVLAAASHALAGDPVYTAKDLDAGLKDLSWLLGNWEADGDFMGTKYKEFVRYWPEAGGKALMERAYAVVEKKTIIHQDRIVFTKDDDGMKASFYEAQPARVTRYEIKISEAKIEFAPLTEGGPKLVYTKTGDDSYDYVFTGKDEKGGDIKATGKAKRTNDAYPDPKKPAAGETLKPLAGALGEFEGTATREDKSTLKEKVTGRTILGGDVLEIVVHDEGNSSVESSRTWAWFDAGTKAWRLDRLSPHGKLTSFTAKVEDGKLVANFETEHVGLSLSWEWKDKSYTFTLKRFIEKDQRLVISSTGILTKKKSK